MLVFPSNPNTGDVFGQWMWDGTKWTRGSWSAAFTLEGLTDVSLSDLVQGETLTWDAGAEKWMNAPLPEVPEVDLSAYATQQYVHDQIAAIPAPPIPSLAGLSDTSLANLAAGQALTWSGSQWVNSSTFAPISIGSAARGILFYARDSSTANTFQIDNSSADYVRLNVENAGSGMILATQGVTRALIDNNGRMTINPFSNATTVPLVVNQNNLDGYWTAQFYNSTASSYGVYIKAASESGGTAIGAALSVVNNLDANIFALFGNGAINMGPAYLDTGGGSWIRTPVTIDWMGNVTIGMSAAQATNPARCVINENKPAGNTLITYNSGAAWNTQIINTNTAGTSYGLLIQAGISSNDWAFQVVRRAGAWTMFGVRGDGNIMMPGVQQTATGDNLSAEGWMSRRTSLRAVKTNVRSVSRQRARDVVRKLRAIQFNSLCKADDPARDCYGLIAEEVAAVEPNLATYDADGKLAGVSYDRVALLLLPLLQELLEMEEPEELAC